MNNFPAVIEAYAVGLILLWGFAISMWCETRAVARRRSNDRKTTGGGL